MINYKAIGKRIRAARTKIEYTQEYLAELIGVTPPYISNIERGTTKLSLPTIINIANALEVSVDALLCDTIRQSEVIFKNEARELFQDCSSYELRVMVDVLKATKESLRKNIFIKS